MKREESSVVRDLTSSQMEEPLSTTTLPGHGK